MLPILVTASLLLALWQKLPSKVWRAEESHLTCPLQKGLSLHWEAAGLLGRHGELVMSSPDEKPERWGCWFTGTQTLRSRSSGEKSSLTETQIQLLCGWWVHFKRKTSSKVMCKGYFHVMWKRNLYVDVTFSLKHAGYVFMCFNIYPWYPMQKA